MRDVRGAVVRRIETAQTFLTATEIDNLVDDYLAGAGIQELAERYGIHRATVYAHLRRRNTPRRRLGLGEDELAEVVRLYRDGASIRSLARRTGIDRKAIRASLVQAEVVIRT